MDAAAWRLPGIFLIINILFLFLTSKVLKIDALLRYQVLLFQYFIIGQTLFLLVTMSVYNRMIQLGPRNSVKGLAVRIVLGPMFILAQSEFILHLILANTEPSRLALISGYSFGLTMFIMDSYIVVEVVFFMLKCLTLLRSNNVLQAVVTGTKRTGLQKRILIGVTFALSCISFYIAAKHSAFPEVVRIKIPVKGLPISFNNTVIVQLSDMHIGVLNGKTAVNKVVDVSNSLAPDLVAITGDTAEGVLDKIKDALSPLERLKSKFGVYITTGMLLMNMVKHFIPYHSFTKLFHVILF